MIMHLWNGPWVELNLFEFVRDDARFFHGTAKVDGQLKHRVEPNKDEDFIGSAKGRRKTPVNAFV